VVSAKILSQSADDAEPTVREVYVAVVADLKKRNAALDAAIAEEMPSKFDESDTPSRADVEWRARQAAG